MRVGKQITAIVLGGLVLAGCSALPAQGPTASDVVADGAIVDAAHEGYMVVDLDTRAADILASKANASLKVGFGDHRPPPDAPIGIGDSVSVTIWEAAAGGLFSSPLSSNGPGSRSVVIPDQVVARDGSITVPYAGRIAVVGSPPPVVERKIIAALANKAIEPQALVTVSRNISHTATVTGEVATGTRVPLSVRGDRIHDVIAAAGGIKAPVHETFVSLSSEGRTITVPLQVLTDRPVENIFVRPGDTLTLVRDPQTYTAFGATGRNSVVSFDARGITLEEAIAKAGGLLDLQSDPSSVFVLRKEPVDMARRLDPHYPVISGRSTVDVVYRLDLRNTNSFFLARRVSVQNKDIVYVANAPITNIQKVLSVLQQAATPVVMGKALTQ
jgi:polysaccharide export outer membrane protein